MTNEELGAKIGLTGTQVRGWANHNGIKKGRSRLFFDDELEFIEQNYLNMSYREIADILGYTETQIRGWINNNLKNKYRTFNDDYFEIIDTPDRAYWLGFIYADGWISSHIRSHRPKENGRQNNTVCYEFGIELQRCDEYILHKLNDAIGGVHKIKQLSHNKYVCGNKSKSVTESSVLRVYSKKFVSGLIKNGIAFNKTKSDVFPIVDDSLFIDFLRGYIDGDGCIHEMKPGVLAAHITGANKRCLEHIQEKLLFLYGIHTSLYTENDRKHRLYCFRKDDVKCLLDLIYANDNCLKLHRKYEKYKNFYGLAA